MRARECLGAWALAFLMGLALLRLSIQVSPFREVRAHPAASATVSPTVLPIADPPTATPPPTQSPSASLPPSPTSVPPPTWTPTPQPTPIPASSPTWTPTPRPTPISPSSPTWTPTPIPPTAERWIEVILSTQTLNAYEGDRLVRSWRVSTGLPHTPTPTGDFHIWVKLRYDDMEGPGYYLRDVPYVMYFYGGYGIHGVYWHANFGHPMSHGCVNMPTDGAAWLFDWASVGTLVRIRP